MLYMVTWIPSIYPSHVSIYTSTMDPSWVIGSLKLHQDAVHVLSQRRTTRDTLGAEMGPIGANQLDRRTLKW